MSVSRPAPAARVLGRRVSRAALTAAGAAVVTACSSGGAFPPYGLAPDAAYYEPDASDASVLALYGAPPEDAAAGLGDASPDADASLIALYGGPPTDGGPG